MNPLLQVNNLAVDFISEQETIPALKNISFYVHRGEVLALVGESGSGKSVSALSILRLLPTPPARYRSGEILFTGKDGVSSDLLKRSNDDMQHIRGNDVAMIFQEPMTSLNPVLRCGVQVMEAVRAHKKCSATTAKAIALEWLRKVKLPNPERLFFRYPHQVSGGQKQRVMIAMAMCCHPSLLICDEPTTALDVTVQASILDLIRELQQETDMGVIFITHDLGVVASVADRAAVMYRGSIVESNTVQSLFTDPQHAYTKALLACRPLNHRKGDRLPVVSDFLDDEPGMSPRINTAPMMDQPALPKVLLSVKNLSTWFPIRTNLMGKALEYTKAVDDVSFEVFRGETIGLVGESGCGKTTLGRTLLRLIEPTKGTILYRGMDLVKQERNQLRSLRKEIQIIFQDPYSSLNPRLTIGAAITEVLYVHEPGTTSGQRRQKVNDLLEKVNLLPSHFNRYPHEFSGGQRQRIVIARALALNPSFLVCDESVSALDISVQAQVLNLLNDLKREFGFTIIFISHDLSVVHYLSDRIIVMNKGRIEESGSSDAIYFTPQSDYTRRLIAAIPRALPTT